MYFSSLDDIIGRTVTCRPTCSRLNCLTFNSFILTDIDIMYNNIILPIYAYIFSKE